MSVRKPAGLTPPPQDLRPNRRDALQHRGALRDVPYGVQMCQSFSDAPGAAARASGGTSAKASAKRKPGGDDNLQSTIEP